MVVIRKTVLETRLSDPLSRKRCCVCGKFLPLSFNGGAPNTPIGWSHPNCFIKKMKKTTTGDAKYWTEVKRSVQP